MIKIGNELSLEKRIREIHERHKNQVEKHIWNFYDYMPWERGADSEKGIALPQPLVTAIETSMLTELNLPWYTTYLADMFRDGLSPLQEFIHDWVSEEEQHSTALETYLVLNGSVETNKLASLKKEMLVSGWDSTLAHPVAVMAYTSIQELATVVFYRNIAVTARAYDPTLEKLLIRLANDESLHYAFYNQAIDAHLELDPDLIVYIAPVIKSFKMPGAVLKDFDERMKIIEGAGYGADEYLDQVLEKLLIRWKIASLTPKTQAGRAAREDILTYVAKLKRINERMKRRR